MATLQKVKGKKASLFMPGKMYFYKYEAFDTENYNNSTDICKIISEFKEITDKGKITVIGGGDTVSAIDQIDPEMNFTHKSTGGGSAGAAGSAADLGASAVPPQATAVTANMTPNATRPAVHRIFCVIFIKATLQLRFKYSCWLWICQRASVSDRPHQQPRRGVNNPRKLTKRTSF